MERKSASVWCSPAKYWQQSSVIAAIMSCEMIGAWLFVAVCIFIVVAKIVMLMGMMGKISNYNETTLMLLLKIPDKNVKSVFA